MGSLQFAAITDPILKARLKDINRVWRRRATSRLRDRQRLTPPLLCKQLRPWTKTRVLARRVPLCSPPPSLIVHTDASNDGWGGHSPSRSVQGVWSTLFRAFHINILEAMAVLLSLKRLRPKKGIHIRLVLDSNTIVHCINRRGSRSPHINHVILAILSLARKKKWHLSAVHLEGVRNVVADSLSRKVPLESEWELDARSFSIIM